ncbi:uncharacterized protein ACNS7B_003458 [Menidia menidia]
MVVYLKNSIHSLLSVFKKKAGPRGGGQRLSVLYSSGQQQNVFIQHLQQLHSEARGGPKEEHRNGGNFPDNESLTSTGSPPPEAAPPPHRLSTGPPGDHTHRFNFQAAELWEASGEEEEPENHHAGHPQPGPEGAGSEQKFHLPAARFLPLRPAWRRGPISRPLHPHGGRGGGGPGPAGGARGAPVPAGGGRG